MKRDSDIVSELHDGDWGIDHSCRESSSYNWEVHRQDKKGRIWEGKIPVFRTTGFFGRKLRNLEFTGDIVSQKRQ